MIEVALLGVVLVYAIVALMVLRSRRVEPRTPPTWAQPANVDGIDVDRWLRKPKPTPITADISTDTRLENP